MLDMKIRLVVSFVQAMRIHS